MEYCQRFFPFVPRLHLQFVDQKMYVTWHSDIPRRQQNGKWKFCANGTVISGLNDWKGKSGAFLKGSPFIPWKFPFDPRIHSFIHNCAFNLLNRTFWVIGKFFRSPCMLVVPWCMKSSLKCGCKRIVLHGTGARAEGRGAGEGRR